MGEVQPHDDPGVNALVAVTDVSADPQDVAGEIGRLLRVIMEALAAQAVVLQAADPRAGRFTVLDSVNLDDWSDGMHNAPLTEGAAGQAHFEGTEMEVDQAGLPGALREAGYRFAIALPVRTVERSHGVIWVAGADPLADHRLCRHAARVGAERIAGLLEQERLSETLERAMAQILEGDERMLGRIGLTSMTARPSSCRSPCSRSSCSRPTLTTRRTRARFCRTSCARRSSASMRRSAARCRRCGS